MAQTPLIRRLNRVQKSAVDRAVKMLKRDGRCLIVMTTGTGKTITGSKVIRHFKDAKVLWLTQTDELIFQTKNELEKIFDRVGLIRRDKFSTEEDIIVASLQTLCQPSTLKKMPKHWFDILVVDEAHHAMANTWKKTVEHFDCMKLGLTATPSRHDGKDISELFGDSAFELSYEDAKKQRLIAEEIYKVILTNSKIEGISTRSKDYRPSELDKLVVSIDRNHAIVESYKKYGRAFIDTNNLPRKAICFCITVAHAIRMRDLFRANGISSEVLVSKHSLYANTDKGNPLTEKDRRETYEAFLKNEGAEILCVVNVLNEGKNIPDVGCLLMARPTRSATIYAQQMGRGCRRIEGVKEKYIVLDFVDLINWKYPPMSLSKIAGRDLLPEQIIPDFYHGKDPIVVDEYVNYLSHSYEYQPEDAWTKKDLDKAILKFYRENKKIRARDLGLKETGLPSKTSVLKFYDSVRDCFQKLNIPMGEPVKSWTKLQAMTAIWMWVRYHGHLRIVDLKSSNNMPSIKVIKKYWGSFPNCLKELELTKWDSRKIAKAIAAFKEKRGRFPYDREFTSAYNLPSMRQVKKIFGNLTRATNAASVQ